MTDHLPQYVIAYRVSGSPWPINGPSGAAITKARHDYDKGLIEMAQRREDNAWYLYAIPRQYPITDRPGYFEQNAV